MLTSEQRSSQIKSQVKKEFDHKRWTEDIHRYERYKKIIKKLENKGSDASFWWLKLAQIRERYPNIKDWP